MHIGLIRGIGPSSTQYYYRHLVAACNKQSVPLELTISQADINVMIANMATNDADKQAEILLTHTKRLQAAGADCVAVTSLGGHFCIRELEELSPLPVINLVPILDQYFLDGNIDKVGVLGTTGVMRSKFFGGVNSAQIILPPEELIIQVNQRYLAMALNNFASEDDRQFFFRIGQKMCSEQGAQTVVLAGTDLFLAFEGVDSGFNVIDAALVHVEALTRLAGQQN